jgi:hypothetical protein
MPNFHSFLGGLIPGYEKLFHRIHDAQAKQQQRTEERSHDSVIRSCQHRSERANAERIAFEAERDGELYRKAVGGSAPAANTIFGDDCELERLMLERAGLRRLRESISVADLNHNGVGQALTQALTRPLAAPSIALSLSSGQVAQENVSSSNSTIGQPAIAPTVSAEDVDKLAIRFVTRIGTAADGAEREMMFNEWRNELHRQLPQWQAQEVEERARVLMNVVA